MAAAQGSVVRGPITNKVIAVNGGSRGIGLGFVKKFLERGNQVYAGVRQVQNANQLHELCSLHPGRLAIIPLDVCDSAAVSSWAENITNAGINHVDVVVNCAGIYSQQVELKDVDTDDFMMVMKTNALGPLLCVQQLQQRQLLGGPQGSVVVNITSVMGSHGDVVIASKLGGRYAYRSSKAALNAVNKALAMDLGPQGTQCVVVHPGYVKTDMNSGNGWISVDDSVEGMMSLLEGALPLNGHFYAYDGQQIPW